MSVEVKRIFDIPYFQLEKYPLPNAYVSKGIGHRTWDETSTTDFVGMVNKVSKGLLDIGVKAGDRLAIISNNRTEWNIIDFAILQVGAVNVPVYPTISTEDYLFIFKHAEIKYCFVSSEDIFDKISSFKDKLTNFKEIYTFNNIPNAKHLSKLVYEKADLDSELETIKNSVKPENLATIIYTSGTTGTPKGVMLSHNNIVSNVIGHSHIMPTPAGGKALSFLPISHAFERLLVYYYSYHGVAVYYAESIEAMGKNLLEVKPNVMTVVPRLLEKVYDKIYATGLELKGIKRLFFFWALDLGFEYEPYGANGSWYEFKLAIARKLVFKKWKQSMGGELNDIVVGGAALQDRLARIFSAAGITIMEGYGMSETSPVVSVNGTKNGNMKIGTVGRPAPNIDVKIADDGEILIRGPIVMMGYYKNEELTAECFTDDGYFKTNDIGLLDEDGFLRITDRKNEMFKTSGGKYIAPAVIENAMKESRFIEQVMVIGEGRKMPVALVQVDFAFVREWCRRKKITIVNDNDVVTNKAVINKISEEIEKRNKQFGNWEQIKKFKLVPDVWSVNDGHLSQTLKLKRKVLLNMYINIIEEMYS
jgi:long-chain acyl-CoA synthetase